MIIPTHVYFLRLSTYTSVFNTDVSLAIGQVYNINMTKPIQMKISITRDTRPLPFVWIILGVLFTGAQSSKKKKETKYKEKNKTKNKIHGKKQNKILETYKNCKEEDQALRSHNSDLRVCLVPLSRDLPQRPSLLCHSWSSWSVSSTNKSVSVSLPSAVICRRDRHYCAIREALQY